MSEIYTETRRQVFRTSILSAVGLMSCTSGVTSGGPNAVSDPHDMWIMKTLDNRWLFFGEYNFLKGYKAYFFTEPDGTDSKSIDLAMVANRGDKTPAGTIDVKAFGTNAPLSIIDSYVSTADVTRMAGIAQLTWNEIGSK